MQTITHTCTSIPSLLYRQAGKIEITDQLRGQSLVSTSQNGATCAAPVWPPLSLWAATHDMTGIHSYLCVCVCVV